MGWLAKNQRFHNSFRLESTKFCLISLRPTQSKTALSSEDVRLKMSHFSSRQNNLMGIYRIHKEDALKKYLYFIYTRWVTCFWYFIRCFDHRLLNIFLSITDKVKSCYSLALAVVIASSLFFWCLVGVSICTYLTFLQTHPARYK